MSTKARFPAVVAAAAYLAVAGAYAQTTPPPSPATAADAKAAEPAAPPPIFSIWGFDLTGHLDVGYTHLTGSGKFVSGANDRVFDFKHNEVFFHALDLQFAKTPDDGWGGLLDITLGKDADTIAAYGTISKSKGPANGANHYADATQFYVYYGAAPFSIIAGKYVTLAGAEVIKSDGDVNYSRSILFGYAIPFTHTGVRATYKVNDALSLIGGVNQGWDAFEDPNHGKTVELGATFAPSKVVSIAASYYGGKERVTNYPKSAADGMRNLFDIVGTFNATDQLAFILNYDYGTQDNAAAGGGKAKWDGIAGYANYQINDQWRTSLRGEYFNDHDGYRTGVVQKWKEATLTLAYLPVKEWEVRAEVRADKSDQSAFLKPDGITPTSTQRSFGLEVLYKF
ncbi:MAG: porin [Pseudomonadota bacterium]|nr:porin [Pseudomonadota bacterium]